jgi:hypothetical protein
MNDQTMQYQQIIAKCWADEGFKQQLLADPVATLKQAGAELPEGLTLRVLENTERVLNLVIPAKMTDLDDEALKGSAGGGWVSTWACS